MDSNNPKILALLLVSEGDVAVIMMFGQSEAASVLVSRGSRDSVACLNSYCKVHQLIVYVCYMA